MKTSVEQAARVLLCEGKSFLTAGPLDCLSVRQRLLRFRAWRARQATACTERWEAGWRAVKWKRHGKNGTEENSWLVTGECPQAAHTHAQPTHTCLGTAANTWSASSCQQLSNQDAHTSPFFRQTSLQLYSHLVYQTGSQATKLYKNCEIKWAAPRHLSYS